MRFVPKASVVLLPLVVGVAAHAAEFPISVCPAVSGKVLSQTGIDGDFAEMKGSVSRETLKDYCRAVHSSPQANGATAVADCLRRASSDLGTLKLRAFANCRIGIVAWTDGRRAFKMRLPATAETCSSSKAVLLEQFKLLCPTAAKMYELH